MLVILVASFYCEREVKPVADGLDAKDEFCVVDQICGFCFRQSLLKGCTRQHRWLSKNKRGVKGKGFMQSGAFGCSKTIKGAGICPVSLVAA